MLDPVNPQAERQNRRDIIMVVLFALLAGTLLKIPELFGLKITDAGSELFYVKNLSLFILPFVAAFFLIKRGAETKVWWTIFGIFALAAVVINIYPSYAPHHTAMLSGLHLPLFLWLLTGAAYIGHDWQGRQGRMNFIPSAGDLHFCGVVWRVEVLVGSQWPFFNLSALMLKVSLNSTSCFTESVRRP